jgi:putative ABC transport system substrate-binding protein
MRRRTVLAGIALSLAAGSRAAFAQAPAKLPLVGILGVDPGPLLDAFRQGLQKLGYVEGQTIVLIERSAPGHPERLGALAEEMVSLKPNVIVVPNSADALVAKQASTAIPIVVATMADPERLKLIESDARPGGNVTGILVNLDGLPGKQLEVAVEIMSGATKIGFLFNVANPGIAFLRPELEAAANRLKVTLVRADVRSPGDLDAAFRALAAEHVDIVLVGQDAMLRANVNLIASLAATALVPFVGGQREYVEAGGLVSYGISLRENYQRAAYYVDRILKGAKPSELPAELPTKVEMVINRKAAGALGITIPPALLLRADDVIE